MLSINFLNNTNLNMPLKQNKEIYAFYRTQTDK